MNRSRALFVFTAALVLAAASQLAGARVAVANGVDSRFAGSAVAEQSSTAPPSFSLSSSTYSVSEGQASVAITIMHSGTTGGTDSVQLTSMGGSATAGQDYTGLPQTVYFTGNESEKTVSILIVNDTHAESDETLLIVLSSPSAGCVLAHPSTAILTIRDGDSAEDSYVGQPSPNDDTATGTTGTTGKGKIASAKLSKKKFTAAQAKKVKLTVKFAPKSKKFAWKITLKHGKKWKLVKSVNKTGSFKKIRITVKRLFAGKKLKKGAYKLRLSADRNSRTLRFRIR
jgi:hypothetical protein